MGCWHETCAVSKMTIYTDEDVRFLLIAQNPFSFTNVTGHPDTPVCLKGGNGCYLTDFWQPVCPPILTKYNDYGSIEKCADAEQKYIDFMLHVANTMSVKLDIGENSCHDVAVPENMDFSQLLDTLQEGRLYLRAHGKMVATSGIFIKESVWQSLITDENFSETDYSDLWRADEMTTSAIRARLNKQQKANEKFGEDIQQMSRRDGMSEEEREELLDIQLEISSHQSTAWHMNPYRHLMRNILPPNDPRLIEMERVFAMLSALRINLSPTIGSGSQTSNEHLFRRVYQLWGEIADKQTHRFDELDEE